MTPTDPKETFGSLRKSIQQLDNFVAGQLVGLYRFRVTRPLRFFAFCVVTLSLLFGMMHFYPPITSKPVFDSIGEFLLVISILSVAMHFAIRFMIWLMVLGMGRDPNGWRRR